MRLKCPILVPVRLGLNRPSRHNEAPPGSARKPGRTKRAPHNELFTMKVQGTDVKTARVGKSIGIERVI